MALARYAALCQEAGLVPIVEPEVLMDGEHDGARCAEVTEAVLRAVFAQLAVQRVSLEAMVLKPNMVAAGLGSLALEGAAEETLDDVADATVRCLRRTVPAAVAGIAFLSGGQAGALATARLNAMHLRYGSARARTLPWPLTFSFARALQQPALALWAGHDANRVEAQRALLHRARCNAAALRGEYDAATETT
jgi:fructose-bisphosphate aldolase class I